MSQRILTLSGYFLGGLLFSLAGLLYILLSLAFYMVFFDPTDQTPHADYFILVVGLYGAITTFLITLTVASRANRSLNFPLLIRLPSRVEYLTAVLISALFAAGVLQLLVATLAAARNGPDFSTERILAIPPLWIAINILTAVLALHASDLVTAGWSRVQVYGVIAILLFGQEINGDLIGRLSDAANSIATRLLMRGLDDLAMPFTNLSGWLADRGATGLGQIFGFVFWPFRAIADATIAGFFDRAQALAPAILLLYATILFMLAADLFATKDLFLTE